MAYIDIGLCNYFGTYMGRVLYHEPLIVHKDDMMIVPCKVNRGINNIQLSEQDILYTEKRMMQYFGKTYFPEWDNILFGKDDKWLWTLW